jgi:hypothetical protein
MAIEGSPVKQKIKKFEHSKVIQVMCCLNTGGPPSKSKNFNV